MIVVSSEALISTRALPDSTGSSVVLLSKSEIQGLADTSGRLGYFEVFPVRIVGDSATLAIALRSVSPRQPGGAVVMSGASSCEWIAVRHPTGWSLAGRRSCFTID